MRLMSFSLTTDQVRRRSKTVTRRRGWHNLRAGELFCAVEKAMGLKPGETVHRLAVCVCVSNRPESLFAMPHADCALEGFPELSRTDFIAMFCRHMGGDSRQTVNRIEFRYVPGGRLEKTGIDPPV